MLRKERTNLKKELKELLSTNERVEKYIRLKIKKAHEEDTIHSTTEENS